MPTPFSSQDLGRIFDGRTLTHGRSLGLAGGVAVQLDGDTLSGVVQERAGHFRVRITPSRLGRRVVFDHQCSCGIRACAHLAAVAFAALDRFPELRRPEQQTFFDALVTEPETTAEPQRAVFELAPAEAPYACMVATLLVGERGGGATVATPAQIAADGHFGHATHEIAQALGGTRTRTGVPTARVDDLLRMLVQSGQARWHAGGQRLVQGDTRIFPSTSAVALPPRSGVIVGATGPWYVDAATGAVARIRIRPPAPPPRLPVRPTQAEPRQRRVEPPTASVPVIVERPLTPLLRLTRLPCPDEFGRMGTLDGLLLEFDYAGAVVPFDDDRQFVRAETSTGSVFVRRDAAGEAAVLDAICRDGLVRMRMASGQAARGRMVFVFRGRDAAEAWQAFVTERLPALQGLGWGHRIDGDFGPRLVESVGACDMRVADAPSGRFSLELRH